MKDKEILKNILNEHRIIIVFGTVLICTGLYVFIPRLFIPRPIIYTLTPETIMENSNFNSDKSITISGERFDNLVAVYVNGAWEPECNIISQTKDTIQLILPSEYYSEEKKLDIQVQTKINSDLFGMSNKMEFTVLSDDDIEEPKVSSFNPDVLCLEQGIIQKIVLEGENFNQNSVVTINDIAVDTLYTDNTLTVSIPFWEYYKEKRISLKVVQCYEGYATSVESSPLYIEIDPYITDEIISDEDVLRQNQQLMIAYLKALKNEDYIVIFAVTDESSCAMTDEITALMSSLGLKENLKEAGFRNSYIAVLDGSNLIHEELGKDILSYDNDLNGVSLHVESANINAGDFSVIQIQGTDYSVNSRGLNIVVYSKGEDMVIDRVSFDTYEGLSLTR